MCNAGTGSESLGSALARSQSCSGAWGRDACGGGALVPPPVKGEGDTPCPSPGRDTQLSGLGSALGSCEGRGLEQAVGNTLFNGLRVLSLETFVGSADPGFLCLVRITCKA